MVAGRGFAAADLLAALHDRAIVRATDARHPAPAGHGDYAASAAR
ncbi:hypothetical protein ACFQU9_22490 [Actinomadura namibiensis]